MGLKLPSRFAGRRPPVLLVLTLTAFSALAAASLAGVGGSHGTTASGAAPAKAGAAPVATSAKSNALTTAALVPVIGNLANKAATPGWVSVNNKGLSLQSGLAASAAPSAQALHIAMSLNLQDFPGLQAFIKSAHTPGNKLYGQVLTTAQFNSTYAPTAAQAKAVTDYLAGQGFRNISVAPNRALITADGTVGVAEAAFNTHVVDFTWQGKSLYANTTDVQVPTGLNGAVLSVAGLNDIQWMHLPARTVVVGAGTTTQAAGTATAHPGYTAPQFADAYDANSVTPAYGTSVAIITGGDDLSHVIPQLRLAERATGRPPVPVQIFNVVPVPTTADAEADGEWDLDSQSSTGIAENVNQLLFYNGAGLDDASIIAAATKFATDDIALAGNMSFGGCENLNVQSGELPAYEQAFAQAAAQGQTWFASSGDEGSACPVVANTGTPAGVPDVSYPSSSPNVVAVGGTQLMADGNNAYVTEAAWLGGGGGISNIFAPPQWQTDSGAVPSATAAGAAAGLPVPATTIAGGATGAPTTEAGVGRGVPDVAMSGDPYSGLITIVEGTTETVGGTSLSSPLAMGAYARMQTAHCNKLGFGAPQFYALDTAKGMDSLATSFNDVTSGTNGMYMAGTGWDYTTGFGSFDVAAVNKALPAAAGCTLGQRPVAKLASDHAAGSTDETVIYSGTGSSDPDGNQLVQYSLDYGDNSDLTIQNSPVFAAHAYQYPGTYTPTLTVRDATGNASLPVTLPITIIGPSQACTAPGQVVGTSPAGVNVGTEGMDIAMGEDDLTSVSMSEPESLTNKLVVTIKVNNLSATPTPMPAIRWATYFNVPGDANNYYVAMVTSDGAAPTYEYGLHTVLSYKASYLSTFTTLGALDATSTYTSDGTITLVLDKSKIGTGLKSGQMLTNIIGQTLYSVPDDPTGAIPAGSGAGKQQDSASQLLTYTLLGPNACDAVVVSPPISGNTPAPASTMTPTPATGSMPPSGSSSTPTPTSTPSSASNPPDTGLSPVAPTPTESVSGNNTGRGGAGAFGWLVLMPLSAAALRRRKRGKDAARRLSPSF